MALMRVKAHLGNNLFPGIGVVIELETHPAAINLNDAFRPRAGLFGLSAGWDCHELLVHDGKMVRMAMPVT